jgi:RimJ/RimL family protein N-acetyltransferase
MQPVFETERLILRPFELTDAAQVQKLAGDIEVAKTTLSIPYPYPDGAAESWISGCRERSQSGDGFAFAMVTKDQPALIGCISINLTKQHNRGELAYWVGRPYWRQGYAAEAAKQVIHFGFEALKLNKIWAAAMVKNPASSNVMSKVGMKHEGTFKEHIIKWDQFEDLVYYGILKTDYENRAK